MGYQRWTDEEWAVIRAELDAHPHGRHHRARKLMPLLPGRSESKISNALNIERRRRVGLCTSCGAQPVELGKQCWNCRDRQREYRANLVRQGICQRCAKNPIDDAGTATTCSACIAVIREKYEQVNKRQRKKAVALRRKAGHRDVPPQNMLKWLGSRAKPFMINNVPPDTQVVDLFGGSGDLTIRARMAGHAVIGFNDIHPMIAALATSVQQGRAGDIEDRMEVLAQLEPNDLLAQYQIARDNEDRDPIAASALLVLVSRNVAGKDMRGLELARRPEFWSGFLSAARKLERGLNGVTVTCLDFADAIERFDGPDTLFLCDPPFPGAAKLEYRIEGRHRELVDRLKAAQGNFIAVTKSCRPGIRAFLPAPYLYFRRGSNIRDVIASSFPLEGSLTIIDHDQYAPLTARQVPPRSRGD